MNVDLLPGATAHVTPKLARFLARLDRPALEAVAQAAIDRLDDLDGDIDLEPNGDERDGTAGEDDFVYFAGYGPGCPIADSGMSDSHEHEACGEYGLYQGLPENETAAFIEINQMSQAEVEAAMMPDQSHRRRLTGRLSLAYARGGC